MNEEPKQIKCYCGHTDYCDCGPIEEPKQETLEEVADKSLQDEIKYWYEKTGSLTSEDIVRRAYSLGITEGAKWQQERMYSEEEVIKIVEKSRETGLTAEYLLLTEQFKKK
jgi:hypothetical protein